MEPPSELIPLERSQVSPLIQLGTPVVQVLSSRLLFHSWTILLQPFSPIHFLERQDPEGKACGALPIYMEVFFPII